MQVAACEGAGGPGGQQGSLGGVCVCFFGGEGEY